MKRLERLGSAAFATVTIALVFHLLAMSFDPMIVSTCIGCDNTSPVEQWETSINQRCYEAPLAILIETYNKSVGNLNQHPTKVTLCIPNKYIKVKDPAYAYVCLIENLEQSHTACALGVYNSAYCYCDYSSLTKLVMASTILTALTLGVMLFLSHMVSFVKIDYVLRWLVPLCFGLLTFAAILILVTLIATGSKKHEDVNELIYSSSIIDQTITSESLYVAWEQVLQTKQKYQYNVKFGWCFGLEIMAFYFTIVSIVLYALMFTAKQRPESASSK